MIFLNIGGGRGHTSLLGANTVTLTYSKPLHSALEKVSDNLDSTEEIIYVVAQLSQHLTCILI